MQLDLAKINSFTFEPSTFCNLHCPQCPRYDTNGYLDKNLTQGHLSLDSMVKNFDLTKLPSLQNVIFEGDYGDPMMNPEIDQFVDFFKDIESIKLITNGSIRNKDYFANLATHKNLQVTFSIDGLEDTNHIYRINSNWNKTIANAKSFINAGGNATWKYIIFKHNQHQVDEARQLASELGFVNFQTQHSNRNFWGDSIWPVYVDGNYQYDLEITDIMALDLPTKSHDKANSINNDNTNFKSPECNGWMDTGKLYVNYLGHLLPCCMTSGVTWKDTISDRLFRKIIGNIDDINLNIHNISDIEQSDFYRFRLFNSWNSVKTCHNTCVGSCSNSLNTSVEQTG